jgi:hypothetical protein
VLFLATLADGASVARACLAAGLTRSRAYEWRSADPSFADAWDQAVEGGTDRLEDSLFARAIETSDVAAIFLLKARRPQYRDRASATVALSHDDLQALRQARELRAMSDEEKTAAVDALIRRRQMAERARAEEDHLGQHPSPRGNGADHC